MSDENTKKDGGFTRRDIASIVRVVQGIMFGVFILGIAMMAGDATAAVELPFKISPVSFTTMIYGALGMSACEISAWRLGREKS